MPSSQSRDAFLLLRQTGQRRAPARPLCEPSGPPDLTSFDLHTDFTGTLDGPVPAAGDEGRPIILNPASGAAAMTLNNGRLVANTLPGTAGAKASYFQQPLPGVSRLGCDFAFTADTGTWFGSVTLAIWDQVIPEPYALPNSPCHLTITPRSWEYSVVTNNTTVDSVASGTFTNPLAQDWVIGGNAGTVHRVEVSLYGDIAVFKLPDGSTQSVKDSRVAAVAKNVANWEFYRDSTTDPFMSILRMWGDVNPKPLVYQEVMAASAPNTWYRGDGTTLDETGGPPGTLNGSATYGASLLSARPGAQSFVLDGAGDFVAGADQSKLDITGNASVEAWIYPTAVGGVYRDIVSKYNWGLQITPAGNADFFVLSAANATGPVLTANTAYHVVGVFDGAFMRIYVNGVYSGGAATPTVPTNAQPLRIGSWDGTSEFFTGREAEIAIYPRPLPPGEITEHYLAGITGGPSTVLGVSAGGSGAAVEGVPTGASGGAAATVDGVPAAGSGTAAAGTVTADAALIGAAAAGSGTAPTGAATAASTTTGPSAAGSGAAPAGSASGAGAVAGVAACGSGTAVAGALTAGSVLTGATATGTGTTRAGVAQAAAVVVGQPAAGSGAAAGGAAVIGIIITGATAAGSGATKPGTASAAVTLAGAAAAGSGAASAGSAVASSAATVAGVSAAGSGAAPAGSTVIGIVVVGASASGSGATRSGSYTAAATVIGTVAVGSGTAPAGQLTIVALIVGATAVGSGGATGGTPLIGDQAAEPRNITLVLGSVGTRGLSATAAARRRLGVSFQAPRHLGAMTASRQLVGAAAARSLTATLED